MTNYDKQLRNIIKDKDYRLLARVAIIAEYDRVMGYSTENMKKLARGEELSPYRESGYASTINCIDSFCFIEWQGEQHNRSRENRNRKKENRISVAITELKNLCNCDE